MNFKFYFFIALLASTFALSSCNKKDDDNGIDIQETGQQVGDAMASIDESGGESGSLAFLEGGKKTFARLGTENAGKEWLSEIFLPKALAGTCATTLTFSSCSSNTITRTFAGCTIGGATLEGTVALVWGGSSANCVMQGVNDFVLRVPAFTITGRRGATLTVSKSGTNGQKITWASGSGVNKVFNFSNDGIRRVFVNTAGTTTFDYTTQTTSDLTITGTARTNRVVSGGTLRVTNNLTSVSCDYTPTAVTWNRSTCNCPVSGSWAGTCSDSKTSTVTITGCGTGTIEMGSESQSFSFDRCYGT